jgi:two-component system chemotaxis sensor kinase CheA
VAEKSEGVSEGAGEGDGYGFFEPLPATPSVQPVVAEEGDGFGFFQPLDDAAPSAPSSADAPIEPIVEPVAPVAVVVPERPAAEPRARAAKAASAAAAVGDSSIRVSVEKVDQLINLVGELVITQAMLLQTAAQMQENAPDRLINGLAQLERNTRDLQESVMSIRMLPISFVFSRFPRVVRDLSGKLGKQVELKTSGETTELDKGLIERIADPLTHLIRNSLDHGIELPEKRIAAGKNPVGTITLKAYHQGGNIVIEVGDDGGGLPRNKILAKARERGLQVSDQMTDQEVFNLIFEAGFSTAEQVTDVSGRGVGMDVVRRNIQSMGGRVEIDSMLGVGTRMTVRLPLTLAILDGMSIAVGDQTYILPLSYVIESFQPQVGDIKTLSNQARVIQVRGEYLPVVALHEVFNIKLRAGDFTQGIMVVIDADGIKAALYVDALVGQHQVVIKSLEANYRRVQGISGATIMGDGHVALILDVSAIAGMAKSSVQKAG